LALRQGPTIEAKSGVILVVMDWTWARRDAGASALCRYREEVAEVIRRLSAQGLQVSLAGHSSLGEHNQDDIRVAEDINSSLTEPVPILEWNDLQDALNSYRSAAVVVGTRLHAALLALSQGTPAIALGYQPKARGCLDLINWPFWMDVEGIDVDLLIEMINYAATQRDAVQVRVESARHWIRSAYASALC